MSNLTTFSITPLDSENGHISNFSFENHFLLLGNAIRIIFMNKKNDLSYEELYRLSKELCQNKQAKSLYILLKSSCDKYTQINISNIQKNSINMHEFIKKINQCWIRHCKSVEMLEMIFLYLDRTFMVSQTKTGSIWKLGIRIYKKYINENSDIRDSVIQYILVLIEKERCKIKTNRILTKSLITMLTKIGIFFYLEKKLVEETLKFYFKDSNRVLKISTLPEYLSYVTKCLENERGLIEYYSLNFSRKKLIKTVETSIIKNHTKTLISKGFHKLISKYDSTNLFKTYIFYKNTNSIELLIRSFSTYIEAKGISIIKTFQENKIINELIKFMDKIINIIKLFENNKDFVYTYKRSFEIFINRKKNVIAKLIAKCIHMKLQNLEFKGTNLKHEEFIDSTLTLFRFVNGKGVFEIYYKNYLAKRLTDSKTTSFIQEKIIIDKFKEECGTTFTNKLEGMIKDIEDSINLFHSYKKCKITTSKDNIQEKLPYQINIRVLSKKFWPKPSETYNLSLPESISNEYNKFTKSYYRQNENKKLNWQHSISFCEINANFNTKMIKLICNPYQTIILILFNKIESLRFIDIKNKTKIEDTYLRKTLNSMLIYNNQPFIMKKSSKTNLINDNDIFSINKSFSSVHSDIDISKRFYMSKENKDLGEIHRKHNNIFKNNYRIDACIVRLLKFNKKLTHKKLIALVLEKMEDKISIRIIKDRIESLIDKEYIDRDEIDKSSYVYLV